MSDSIASSATSLVLRERLSCVTSTTNGQHGCKYPSQSSHLEPEVRCGRQLPEAPHSRASSILHRTYARSVSLHRYNPVTREQFDEEVFSHFYSDSYAPPSPPSPNDSASSHRLALMFIILAFGTLMDPALPRYNLEAEKYHQLARAALFKSAIFEDPTLHAVQALVSLIRSTL